VAALFPYSPPLIFHRKTKHQQPHRPFVIFSSTTAKITARLFSCQRNQRQQTSKLQGAN
jgi:hypothetical protein